MHSCADGPVHVAHDASHGVQVSAVELDPSEHVNPFSIDVQSVTQPSRESWLPSSHASLPTRLPSPQTGPHLRTRERVSGESQREPTAGALALRVEHCDLTCLLP